ncbi:MAG: T9SS type A sorting domain-containing protein [Bacteroidales bacterium]|nr:T9SS type A sorting domain-containing protein [Bacteroidales bacterium]
MKHTKLIISVMLLLGFGLTGLQAQEAILATGGEASGNGGSVSYSVGQVTYTTNTGTNGYSAAEGVQQPYEISVVFGLEEINSINLHLSVFPNPATDVLNLKVDDYNNEKLSYQLYDIKGKLLEGKELTVSETQIQTNTLVPSTYFLKVIRDNKVIKTFKVIKN